MDSHSKPRLTPKDFVLYLATMIFLYVSVFSLLALLFDYINRLFPDVQSYVDPYGTGMRMAIATLIIFFPLYAYLTRLLNQDIRKNSEKSNLPFRKWLLYLTLLVAGLGIAGDLVALLYTFLGGEITTRFLLKVLAVLVVAGGVFAYYLMDLKGYWEKNQSQSKIWGAVAGVLVIGTIVAGFAVMGTPGTQRLVRFDQQKVMDLQNIQWQIVNYWQAKQALPANLDELRNDISGFAAPLDPQNGQPYEYSAKGNGSFTLCATFNTENKGSGNMNSAYPDYGIRGSDSWDHGTGRVCFDRTIDPELFPPTKGGRD